jgi:hypothetical protein
MNAASWRGRIVAPVVALVGLLGAGTVALLTSTNASAVTPVTTESEFRAAWGNDADVVLGANITLTCQEGAGNGESEAVRDVGGPGTLDGQGYTITQTCPASRVLQITGDTGAMTISNVTITGGQAVYDTYSGNGGGGIQVTEENPVTIVNTTLTGNVTCEGGGGIELDYEGPFSAINSTISNNQALEEGGGVTGYESGSITLTNSTVTGNTDAADAGGISAASGITLTYSDVVGNTYNPDLVIPACASVNSAAQHSDGHVHAAANGYAANVNTYGGNLTSFASVVSNPIGATNCDLGGGTTTSTGYNYSDDTSCGFDQPTDQAAAGNDPVLGALAANGGPTMTLLPQTGSPLIDAVPNAACQTGTAAGITTDQRGFPRPEAAGGNCDIGAVEVQAPPPPPAPAPAAVVTPRFTG